MTFTNCNCDEYFSINCIHTTYLWGGDIGRLRGLDDLLPLGLGDRLPLGLTDLLPLMLDDLLPLGVMDLRPLGLGDLLLRGLGDLPLRMFGDILPLGLGYLRILGLPLGLTDLLPRGLGDLLWNLGLGECRRGLGDLGDGSKIQFCSITNIKRNTIFILIIPYWYIKHITYYELPSFTLFFYKFNRNEYTRKNKLFFNLLSKKQYHESNLATHDNQTASRSYIAKAVKR